jgi:hypothetical protein
VAFVAAQEEDLQSEQIKTDNKPYIFFILSFYFYIMFVHSFMVNTKYNKFVHDK